MAIHAFLKHIIYCLFLSSLALAQDGYQEVDRVVASIDGEAVTASELSKKGDIRGLGEKELKSLLLEDVLEKEAEQRGLTVKDEDIDAYISEIKQQNLLTDDKFQEVLRQRGLSLDSYRQQVKKEIRRGKVMSLIVRGKINVVDQDIQRYLKQHPELVPAAGTYRVNLIKGDQTTISELRKQALAKGASLRDLGSPMFEDLGYVRLEDLKEEYRKPLSTYSPGEVSELVNLGGEVVVFEILGKIEKEGDVDPALKADVKEAIFKERYQEEIQKLLGDDLFKKHHLEVMK